MSRTVDDELVAESFDDPFEHRWVEVGGLRFHVVEAGPPDGPVALLLHGFPEFWWGWHGQIPLLAAAGYRVVCPDQRGYNLSAKPRGVAAYAMDRLAEDAVGLLDALGVEKAFVAGHDWGAAVTWWLAIRFPERVERAVVGNVPHPAVMRRFLRRDRAQRKRSWYMFFFQLPWLPEWLLRRRDWAWAAKSLTAISRPGTFTPADLDRYRRAWGRPGAIRSMLHWYRAALRKPPARRASVRVTVPMRVLWGLADVALTSEMVAPSLAFCDQGERVDFPELTHWLLHEEPEQVGRAIVEFFDRGRAG